MSNNVTMAAPTDYTTNYTTNNIGHRSYTPSLVASVGFTVVSPPSPTHSLKRRRQFEVDYNSDGDADDEEGTSSDSDDEEDEDKENVALPRKRLCLNLEDSPRLRAAELSSGRSSRASWSSDTSSTYTLLTPPDSPRVVFRPLEIIKVDDDDDDDDEDDVDVKESFLFASDAESPPTSSDESSSSHGSVVSQDNDVDVHYTDSEVELKATTQHPLSFSSSEAEEESGEEEDYGSEEEQYGDVEDEYEDWGVNEEDDYEGEDEDEYNEEGYTVVKNCVAVQVKSYPHYTGMSGYDMFARHCVAGFSSEGGIVVSSAVFSSMMAAQSFAVEEEEEEL